MWAAREWASKLAKPQPLVLVFEDIHWAEEPLLELIEHVAEFVRDAPLFILCLARPELLEVRPGWGGGRMRDVTIELEPLDSDESGELIDALLGSVDLPLDCRKDVLSTTEGTPLFVEETIRMLAENGGEWRRPDSQHAPGDHRRAHRSAPRGTEACAAARRAVGRVFWEGAIEHLSPETDEIYDLDDLHQRELILLENRSSITSERAFKPKHVLIREAAYQASRSRHAPRCTHASPAG